MTYGHMRAIDHLRHLNEIKIINRTWLLDMVTIGGIVTHVDSIEYILGTFKYRYIVVVYTYMAHSRLC